VSPVGDAPSVVLPNGTFMLGSKFSRQQALLDTKTLTWTLTGAGKKDVNSEEGWTLLPSGKVLTVDVGLDYWFGLTNKYNSGHGELYDADFGTWSSAGNAGTQLSAFPDGEIGPAVLMANGMVFVAGAEGTNAIYDSNNNRWYPGPSFPVVNFNGQPVQLVAQDTGAALLPNGRVLTSANVYGSVNPPVKFFEFDGKNLIPQPDIPDSAIDGYVLLLVLPSGQIMEIDAQTDIEIYTPATEGARPWYTPFDMEVTRELHPGGTYPLVGRLLNGVSQGAAEGDNAQMATNYPLVRITNIKTHHVFYSRTHDFSSMAVANPKPATAWFDVPPGQETGPSLLEVVTNGVACEPIPVNVE